MAAEIIAQSQEFLIYKITHIESGKSYIGCTTQGIKKRFTQHVKFSRYKGHGYLHRAIDKYGADAFSIEIVARATCVEEMLNIEMAMIAYHCSMAPDGYNMTAGGDGVFMLCEEAMLRRINSHKGRVVSEETKELLRNRVYTDEQRAVLRKKAIEQWSDPKALAHISMVRRGRETSNSTKLKLSKISKDRWENEGYKEKLSAVQAEAQKQIAHLHADRMRKNWSDPEYRAGMLEARRIAREKKKAV